MVLVTVAFVSRKTGATLQAVYSSVLPSKVMLSHGQDLPATFTFGSHDLVMAVSVLWNVATNR